MKDLKLRKPIEYSNLWNFGPIMEMLIKKLKQHL